VRFDWNRHNLAKIAAHGVSRREVEEALRGWHLKTVVEMRSGEKRYVAIGTTRQGRALEIIVTRRKGKIRVVSAWESHKVRKLLDNQRLEIEHRPREADAKVPIGIRRSRLVV